MRGNESVRLAVKIDPEGLCPRADRNGEIAIRRTDDKVAGAWLKDDTAAEDRSEDDGMKEHAHKAADPVAWAAARANRVPSSR